MITGELIYNPWLNKIELQFNGRKPGINSQAEKLLSQPFYSSLDLLPELFEEELNGSEFCLYFSGTELDFEEVKNVFLKTFRDTGKTQIVHKRKLNNRSSRVTEMDALFKWISESRLSGFDLEQFVSENMNLYKREFQCVLTGCRLAKSEAGFLGHKLVFESFKNPSEMEQLDLSYTPVCYFINVENISSLSEELQQLMKRKDICQNQLFFIWDQSLNPYRLNKEGVIRRIQDLGVENPVFVSSPLDSKIEKYLEVYQATDYLQKGISILDGLLMRIRTYMEQQNQSYIASNQQLYIRIADIDGQIETEAGLRYWLDNQDQLYLSEHVRETTSIFLKKVLDWKKNKDKATGRQEGARLALEFQNVLEEEYGKYQEDFLAANANELREMIQMFNVKIGCGGLNPFQANSLSQINLEFSPLPNLREQFSKRFEMCQVRNMDDMFQRFLGQRPKTPEKQPLYDLKSWRQIAYAATLKITDHAEELALSMQQSWIEGLISAAKKYVEEQTEVLRVRRRDLSSRLSSDEQVFQQDQDWTRQLESKMIQLREEPYE